MSQWVNEWIKEWRSFGTNSHMKEWQNVAGMPCQSLTHPLVTANWRPAASHVLIGSLSHWTCPEVSILMSDECINTKILFVFMQAISYTHIHSLQHIHVVYTCAAEKKRLNTWDASKAGTECFCPSSAYGQVLGGGSNAPCESRHATGTCKVKSQVVTRFEQFEIWKMFLRASSQVVSHLTLITWCHIVSHGVTWCHMVSHRVTWCHVV